MSLCSSFMQRERNDREAGGEEGGVSLEKSFLEAQLITAIKRQQRTIFQGDYVVYNEQL